jgi:hypothetical protein
LERPCTVFSATAVDQQRRIAELRDKDGGERSQFEPQTSAKARPKTA